MWPDMFKRWMDMVFWWLPRDRQGDSPDRQGGTSASSSPPPSPGDQPARKAPETPRPAPGAVAGDTGPTRGGDDLTAIKGIGPAMEERLHSLGIRSYADLSACNPEQLAEQLKADRVVISADRVRGWVQAAGRFQS